MMDQICSENKNISIHEYETIIKNFNKTDFYYSENQTVHEFFQKQVQKNPNNIALVFNKKTLTYAELNNKANKFAGFLKKNFVIRPETFIGLCLDRSECMFITVLAILKAGGTYVPIDTTYPSSRISHIVNDTKTQLILTNEKYSPIFNQLHQRSQVLILNDEFFKKIEENILYDDATLLINGGNLAYVIYTSGTTGTPKGVMITHNSLVNYIVNLEKKNLINNTDIVDFSSNLGFDFSFTTTLGSLCLGATIAIYPDQLENIDLYREHLIKNKVKVAKLTPSYFDLILENIPYSNLNKVILGGEKVSLKTIQKLKKISEDFKEKFPNIVIYDEYGPTETTIGSTKAQIYPADILNIGKPYYNYKAYVLNVNLDPVNIGEVGDLYIGGVSLARGYLNQPALTAEKFIANPFRTEIDFLTGKNSRLYKTGDLVQWLADGSLEYIGRSDSQVKIRGYRIELTEIENAICDIAGVKKSVVLAKENSSGNKYLLAYYLSDESLYKEQILQHLKINLPDYMIPSKLIHLKEFPLSANGKLDLKKLEEYAIVSVQKQSTSSKQDTIEEKILELWAEVLEVSKDKISIKDDFFESGGDSIVAIQLIAKIRKNLNLNVSVNDIFTQRTIENFCINILSEKFKIFKNLKITEKQEVEDVFLANSLQQGLIYHFLHQGDVDDAYLLQNILEYNCSIDVQKMTMAWDYAKEKYPALRLRFNWNEKLLQIIDRSTELDFRYIDLSETKNPDNQAIMIRKIEDSDRCEKYDLKKGNLFRVYFIKRNDQLYRCILSSHHIILDGWSNNILLKFVHKIYNDLINRKKIDEQIDSAYIESQKYLQNHKNDIGFWKNYLRNKDIQLDLSGLLSKEAISNSIRINDYRHIKEPKLLNLDINDGFYRQLKTLSFSKGVTVSAVLHYLWHLILSIYGKSHQTIFGTIVSGRNLPIDDIENSVGLYVNTLPFIFSRAKKNESCIDQIKAVQEDINNISSKSSVHLSALQSGSKRLFDVLFAYQNHPKNMGNNPIEKFIFFQSVIDKIDYPLALVVHEYNEKISIELRYASDLFDKNIMHQILQTINFVLKQIVENPDLKEANLNFLDKSQCKKIFDSNNSSFKYLSNTPVHCIFEDYARKIPEKTAILYDKIEISYQALNEKANQLARHLIDFYHVSPGSLVILCLESSENMIISLLAILKAGAAYVPVDPKYPDERVVYVLKDTASKLLITNEENFDRLSKIILNVSKELSENEKINIFSANNEVSSSHLSLCMKGNLTLDISINSLAYVIYTSGTTGNPKGVMMSHRGITSLVKGTKFLEIDFKDNFLQLADFSFDATVIELWFSLLNGAKLIILKNKIEILNHVELLKNILREYSISVLFLTKALFDQTFMIDQTIFKDLKYFLTGGEALSRDLILSLKQSSYAPKNIINCYGPTENSVISSVFNVSCNPENDRSIPIGKPLEHRNTYVLDDYLNPVPINVVGELYVGGEGVGRGYLNKPDITAEKFIANPFRTQQDFLYSKNARLYKTGDLVRYLEDGNLEYVERNDFQVKIRGYRIELAEIENNMCKIDGIKQAVVVAKERKSLNNDNFFHSSKYLVAYYLSSSDLSKEKILEFLRLKLPEYMIPTAFMQLETFPLTINGKLDRSALPDPEFKKNQSFYVAPRNELEKSIAQIWAEILGISDQEIGILEDFYKLGGDSISSIMLVNKLRNDLGLNLTIKDIFIHKNIKSLCERLTEEITDLSLPETKIREENLSGEFELLPIQRWFFDKNFLEANHFNQSFLIKVPVLDLEVLQASIEKLIKQHDVFRLRFKKDLLNPVQYYSNDTFVKKIKILDIRDLKNEEGDLEFESEMHSILTEWQSYFDIENGPLYTIGYIQGYKDGSSRIYFSFHHLIIDTVSWRIISEDLEALYYGKKIGFKSSSYKEWINTIKNYSSHQTEEKDYWMNTLSDYNPNFFYTMKKSLVQKNLINSLELSLNSQTTENLLKNIHQAYNTHINDILLTALGYALTEITDNAVNFITLEGHGREALNTNIDVTRTVGWFTTMYPIRLVIHPDVATSIKNIKEILAQVPNKGIGYAVNIGYKETTLPKIAFNYLGRFDSRANKSWHIVNEQSGLFVHDSNKGYNLININCLIIDNIFTISIESVLELELINKFAKVFKLKLEAIITHCLNKKMTEYTMSDFKDFVPYLIFNQKQERSKTQKIFMFPPAIGGVETYLNNIVQKLPHKNFILFNNYYDFLEEKFGENYTKDAVYEDLAQDYIRSMKSIQVRGPYVLFGWSFGAMLAFEILKQLLSAGDMVSKIVMIDGFFSYQKANSVSKFQHKLLNKENNILCSYAPKFNIKILSNTEVVLFKALNLVEPSTLKEDQLNYYNKHNLSNIFKYYVENTLSNHLDDILSRDYFRVELMPFSHVSWINNDSQLIDICRELN